MLKNRGKVLAIVLLLVLVAREIYLRYPGASALDRLADSLLAASRAVRQLSERATTPDSDPFPQASSRFGNPPGMLGAAQSDRTDKCTLQPTSLEGQAFDRLPSVPRDQVAILTLNSVPDAFTYVVTPEGSVFETWRYHRLGEHINFVNGAYTGGIETPAAELGGPADLPFYPWDLRPAPTPECVVQWAGPAVFLTSALVLPGWNDGLEVAGQWRLAGGGTMITVDGQLAMLDLEPTTAFDGAKLSDPPLYVGAVEGAERLGAILSGRRDGQAFRLSLSLRGQGTTQDGVEIVLDYANEEIVGEFDLGQTVQVGVVDLNGTERSVTGGGRLSVSREGRGIRVEVDGDVDGAPLAVAGWLQNGVWR